MARADIMLGATRLYRAYLVSASDPEVQIALRDGGVRRDLERLVIDTLASEPAASKEVGESILTGVLEACQTEDSPHLTWHANALRAFQAARRPGRVAELEDLADFLDLAGRPSRWGDAYSAAALPDGRGALFRILVQVELGPPPDDKSCRPDHSPKIEVDGRFGRGATSNPALMNPVEDAVRAAFAFLAHEAPGVLLTDLGRATTVRVFRGGLPWPLPRDPAVPGAFQIEQDKGEHSGSSIGLAVALAVIHAFLPQGTLRRGPVCAATGYVTESGNVEAVGSLPKKVDAAVRAGVPVLFPTQEDHQPQPRYGHTAISTLDAAVATAFRLASADVSGFLGAEPDPLVGRQTERLLLDEAWSRARGGEPRLALVHGPPGIGKSHLVARFMETQMQAGTSIVFARSEQTVTHFETIVARLVDGTTPGELRDLGREQCRWLVPMVDGFDRFFAEQFGDVDLGDVEPIQKAVIERKSRSICSLIRHCAGRRGGLLIVIDDLHLGREETWPVLLELLDHTHRHPVLVVATLRPEPDEAGSADAESSLATLRARGVVDDVEIRRLPIDAVESWVQTTVAPDPTLARQITQAIEEFAAGNALATSNHLKELVGRIRGGATAGDLLGVVREVGRDVVSLRLGAFKGLATLKLAATVRTPEFSSLLLHETGRIDAKALRDDLASGQAAGFLKPAGFGRYAFWHAEIRQAVRNLLRPQELGEYSLALAGTLERRAEEEGERLPLADLACYYSEAAPVVFGEGWKKAQDYSTRAADDFTRRYAYDSVLEFRTLAMHAFDIGGRDIPAQRARLLLDLARAHSYAASEARARPLFEEARELAVEAELGELVIDATLGLAGPPEDTGRIDQRLVTDLEEAANIAAQTGDPRRTALKGRATFELVLASRRDPVNYPMPLVTELLAEAERSGDKIAITWALLARLMGLWVYNEPNAERLVVSERMLAIAKECGEQDIEAWAHGFRVIHGLELADRDLAELATRQLAAMGTELHHGYARWAASIFRPVFAFLDGRIGESRRLAEEALKLREDSETSVIYWLIQRMLAWREEGDLAPIARQLQALEELIRVSPPTTPYAGTQVVLRAAWAALYCDLGEIDDATKILDSYVMGGLPEATDDAIWTTGLALLAETCGRLDDSRLAGRLYNVLKVKRGETVVVALAIACLGSVDRYLGILARLDKRWDDAEQHFETALRVDRVQLRSPTCEARTQVDYADMLARRSGPGDLARARELCAAAKATWAALDLPHAADRSQAVFNRMG